MTRNNLIKYGLTALTASTALGLTSCATAQPAGGGSMAGSGQKPNVVFILVDNVGWGDFSCYGGVTPTPRIDELAKEGIRFNNYNVESQCTPSPILSHVRKKSTGG